MSRVGDVDAVVFDVLGTMVDEPTGLRTAIAEAAPGLDEPALDGPLGVWQHHVDSAQRSIERGQRAYAASDVIDAEAAEEVAERAGVTDAPTIARLSTAGQRLPAWNGSAAGLELVAKQVPVLGLSNASRRALLRLNAHAGLRWHQALSAESVGAYKPAAEVYGLAVDAAGCAPDRLLMVAAHAWDLRAAQSVGMRTAYVQRPAGDPPARFDRFDWELDGLDGLAAAVRS